MITHGTQASAIIELKSMGPSFTVCWALSATSLLFIFLAANAHEHQHAQGFGEEEEWWHGGLGGEESFTVQHIHRDNEVHGRRLDAGGAYTLINRIETECELEALSVGTALADRYNSADEATEWDVRIHNDYLTEHLGFASWIQQGTWGSIVYCPINHYIAGAQVRFEDPLGGFNDDTALNGLHILCRSPITGD
jgi:hypothetical protein